MPLLGVMSFVVSVLLLLAITAMPAMGQQESELPAIDDGSSILLPRDFSAVDYYLITVDVGDKVWDNFGHTALRVVDRESNTDLVFNWGLFDASGGSVAFASDFFRGILNYQLGVSPPSWEFNRYVAQERTVWQDRLNLTNEQKARLYRRLAWNLRDENIVYSYQYFFDNCTTRVRDYLNEALGGSLAQRNRALTSSTFRDEVSDHYQSVPIVQFGLDVLMNSRIDRRMSQWEELFLPARLRQELLETPSDVSENGQRLNLLSEDALVAEFPSPQPPYNIYNRIAAALLLPLIFLMFHLRHIPMQSFSAQKGFVLSSPALTYRVLGAVTTLVSLASGFFGLVMAIAWRESGHLDLHHNVNLLVFWPSDILGAIFGIQWLIFGRPTVLGTAMKGVVSFYIGIHVLAVLVYFVLAATGLSEQVVASVALYVVCPLLLLAALVSITGFKAERRIRFN